MHSLEWECFQEIVNDGSFQIKEAGLLHNPVQKISLSRNTELQIILTTVSDAIKIKLNKKGRPLGTVRNNDDGAVISSILGNLDIRLDAIGSIHYSTHTNIHGKHETTETVDIGSLEFSIRPLEEGRFQIEWLENISKHYFWPDNKQDYSTSRRTVTLGKDDQAISFTLDGPQLSSNGWACLHITIGGHKLYLCEDINRVKSDSKTRGFILYKACLTEDVRKKIRNCISFSLGFPIIYLGNSIFNSEWKLVSSYALSPHTYDGKAFSILPQPPCYFGDRSSTEINKEKFGRLVNGLYEKYDEYRLGFLIWQYWHAVCAPVHIKALNFGAAIEALQDKYIEINNEKVQKALLDGDEKKSLISGINNIISCLEIDESYKKILRNRISLFNQSPKSVIIGRFFECLEIEFSQLEEGAWERRNHAAHGAEPEEEDYISLIRETKVLRVILHRMLLTIVNGSDNYFDYYSYDHPIRSIKIGVPSE